MSKRHPGARRRPHQADTDPDDLFIAKTLEFSTWARSNQTVLTFLGVAAVLVFAGIVYYGNFRSTQAGLAAQELEQIYATLQMDDTEGAKTDLADFVERRAGTAYGKEARLILGELYLKDGQSEQALAVLEPVARSPREPIDFQAAALLAAAYEEEGRLDEAVRVHLAIADRSEMDFQITDALEASARIRALQGRHAEAIDLYERLLEGLEETDQGRGIYEMRLAELRQATAT